MREKLAIAKQMRTSRKNYSDNLEKIEYVQNATKTFIIECIIKGKNDFII